MTLHEFVNNQLTKHTQHGMHQLNENFVNHKIKHQYIYIPKNSSSWAKDKLRPANFIPHYNIIPDYTKVVILRDPLKRYISGLAQWSPAQHKLFENDIKALDFVLRYIITTDAHTELQSWFIKDIQDDNTVFFWHDENLQNNFDQYFKSIGIELPPVSPKHLSTDNVNKINAKKIIASYIESNLKNLPHFKKWLAVDYQLCEFVSYYGLDRKNHTNLHTHLLL